MNKYKAHTSHGELFIITNGKPLRQQDCLVKVGASNKENKAKVKDIIHFLNLDGALQNQQLAYRLLR